MIWLDKSVFTTQCSSDANKIFQLNCKRESIINFRAKRKILYTEQSNDVLFCLLQTCSLFFLFPLHDHAATTVRTASLVYGKEHLVKAYEFFSTVSCK